MPKSKRCHIVFIICTFLLLPAHGQKWKLRRYEVGIGFGTTQVFGDIGGTADQSNWLGLKDIKVDETRLAGAINLKYKIDPIYSVSFHSVVGFGGGDDLNSRNNRGRSYKTMITEFSFRWEYYLKPEDKTTRSAAVFNNRGMINNYRTYSLYTFAGIGGIYYHPTLLSKGPLWQEERDIESSKPGFNIAIPLGVGLRYVIDDQWVVGTELGYRWTGTDFLDAYTQSIHSKRRDVYYFLLLHANYRLKTSRRNLPIIFDRSFKSTRRHRRII